MYIKTYCIIFFELINNIQKERYCSITKQVYLQNYRGHVICKIHANYMLILSKFEWPGDIITVTTLISLQFYWWGRPTWHYQMIHKLEKSLVTIDMHFISSYHTDSSSISSTPIIQLLLIIKSLWISLKSCRTDWKKRSKRKHSAFEKKIAMIYQRGLPKRHYCYIRSTRSAIKTEKVFLLKP